MSTFSWFRSVRREKRRRNSRELSKLGGFRPRFEPLEHRHLLATYVVNSVGDTPDGDITDHFADTGSANSMNANFPLTGITTLRAAIQTANAEGGPATIDFHIPGGGVHTIGTAGLPGITVPIIIDGTTQPGFDPAIGKPVIELVSGGAPFGLALLPGGSSGSTIKGLDIHGFSGADILVNSDDNHITGNFLGLDPSGTIAPGNGNGITVTGSGNFIGGTTAAERNVISGSPMGSGVSLVTGGATNNNVYGNYIGTDWTGKSATDPMGGKLGNAIGVRIVASSNFVGNGAADGRNIISGNLVDGVAIVGSTNLVQGNYIGTEVLETNKLPNGVGVAISGGATSNVIGGLTPGKANVISGNSVDGVDIIGAAAKGNLVQGNFIGTDTAATALNLGNTIDGVEIKGGATSNTVGGADPAAANVIVKNGGGGVRIKDAGTSMNKVQGNFIGTNAHNKGSFGNQDGVVISDQATNNTIGGTVAARNVISGNTDTGVYITDTGTRMNMVQSNYIGTSVDGATVLDANGMPLGNTNDGVRITGGADQNTIGGTAAQGNLISGNGGNGVQIISAGMMGNTVQGNFIGTDKVGMVIVDANGKPLGNKGDGVKIDGSANNKIGVTLGTVPDNVISGNLNDGVDITGAAATLNLVRGNYIGTDKAGTTARGNFGEGVKIETGAENNTIGGDATQRNVISANVDGIVILNAGMKGNTVQGNYIGTDKDGKTSPGADGKPLGNHIDGVDVSDSSNNHIGKALGANPDNVISGNGKTGVQISGDLAMQI